MSKERLEEIDQLLSDYYANIDDPFAATDNAIAIIDKVGSLINFAKDQAERVQELEKDIKHYKEATKNHKEGFEECEAIASQVYGLEQQNKRYRDHLKYMVDEAKDHKKLGLRIQHWALIKDLERALGGESDE